MNRLFASSTRSNRTIPYPDECYERSLGRLQSAGFPLVCVDRSLKNLELNVVTVDNIGGAYESTRRLIRRQHRPVWFFGQRNEASSNFARYQGYRQAMCEAGYEEEAGRMLIETDYVVPNPEHWPVEPAPERIRRFLKERCAFPISILACNDGHALATYHAAEELGLTVGRDLFIAGDGHVAGYAGGTGFRLIQANQPKGETISCKTYF